MNSTPSDTFWLDLLKSGQSEAASVLWQNYFRRLLGLARKKLADGARRVADEEDVALSAFHSFCRGAAEGRFEKLDDRHDLWQVLAMITTRKAIRQMQRERAAKRGGGAVRGESAFEAPAGAAAGLQDAASGGPSPEFIAIVDEQLQHLLDRLPNDSLREVTLLKLEGHTNREIAQKVGRHERSVERKLNLIREHWMAFEQGQS